LLVMVEKFDLKLYQYSWIYSNLGKVLLELCLFLSHII
jgi:hypothetical protein